MNIKTKILPTVILALAMMLLATPITASATPPATYVPGSEAALFGHTFTEPFWTNVTTHEDPVTNNSIEIIMHHINYEGTGAFQAALLALGDVYIYENDTHSTFPYQLFGMHFTTPTGKEIFTGAVFAFMYAFNDTNGNNIRDGSEASWFVVPYGYDGGNKTATPSVDAIDVTNPEPGHYRFGMRYNDLYARIVSRENWLAFWLTLGLPLVEFQISELEFIYDIKVNETSGEITAETFYNIGQVQELHVAGIGEIDNMTEVHEALQNVTIGMAHFVTAWGSEYFTDPGTTMPVAAADWIAGTIATDPAGNERAFAVGVRGTYDVINETSGITLRDDEPAIAWVMTPTFTDLLLVGWQLPLSADFLAIWSYAVSPMLQTLYTGPLDVYNHANSAFNKVAFWYAISFPKFGGYRIEHDPVYTAYSNIGQAAPEIPGFPLEAILIGVIVCLVAVFFVRRRKQA
ncbi:MAG: Loki-CTERM sorting domain-containing protein [Candidatus Hodarchaeota archaeon]